MKPVAVNSTLPIVLKGGEDAVGVIIVNYWKPPPPEPAELTHWLTANAETQLAALLDPCPTTACSNPC